VSRIRLRSRSSVTKSLYLFSSLLFSSSFISILGADELCFDELVDWQWLDSRRDAHREHDSSSDDKHWAGQPREITFLCGVVSEQKSDDGSPRLER